MASPTPAQNIFDPRSIQSVTLVTYPDGIPTLISASTAGGTVGTMGIQGTTPQGVAGTNTNPVLIGGLDSNSPQLLQPAQVDSFFDLQTSLGTKLDPYNDNVNAIMSYGYPTQQRFAAASAGTTTISVPLAPAVATASGAGGIGALALFLGLAGLPSLAPVQWGRFTVSHAASASIAITAFNLVFSETVDAQTNTITYTYPLTISQASATVVRYFVPFPQHYSIYPNVTMNFTMAAAASLGYIQVQTLWGFTPLTSYPSEWQWTFNTNVTGSTSTSLLGAPPAGTRIAIEELVVTNGSTTVGTDFSFQSGSNGTTIFDSYTPAGLGFKYGPYPFESPYRMALATALFGKPTASGGNYFVTGRGHYEPI